MKKIITQIYKQQTNVIIVYRYKSKYIGEIVNTKPAGRNQTRLRDSKKSEKTTKY